MQFDTDPHPEIREAIFKLCDSFGLNYWLECDNDERFPTEFFAALREGGWTGIYFPQEFGGSGSSFTAAVTMIQAIAESGSGWTGGGSIHHYLFTPHPIVVFGTPEQKRRFLPPLAQGIERPCMALTEPNTGLDTTRLSTRALRSGDHYIMNGEKVWTTGAMIADRMLVLARTRPVQETPRPIDGLTLFYTAIDRRYVDVRPIKKHGYQANASCQVLINDLPVPVQDRIGEEGKGFRYLLDGLNPERVTAAAMAVGVGRFVVKKASVYATERVVFGRPIGQNQAVQLPLAQCWAELEAANLMVYKAAAMYDAGLPCGVEANAAKFLAAEAAQKACRQAMITHGGFGFAKEFHVERLLREIMIPVLAPVAQSLALCYIAERELGMPKSY